jgi:pimeloyl-ACP methyl ester carboxylesterase
LRFGWGEMAADTAGLIDNLGLGSAHMVGISLRGMIAQILAIEHPERVRSLTSIMSTTGNNQVGQPTDAARAMFLLPPVITREGPVLFNRTVGSPHIRPTRLSCATERCVPSTARSIRRASHANWRRP